MNNIDLDKKDTTNEKAWTALLAAPRHYLPNHRWGLACAYEKARQVRAEKWATYRAEAETGAQR